MQRGKEKEEEEKEKLSLHLFFFAPLREIYFQNPNLKPNLNWR
jgi:hypothetical protein